jgi:ribosomal protein L11 methyltransferase
VIRLALRVRREHSELVLADLLELAPAGVEEVELPAGEGGEELNEDAVYGAPGELPELPDLKALAGTALIEVSTSEVLDDWSERWKQFHRPVLIDPGSTSVPALHVRPPWEPPSERPGVHEIVIDPAQAFGTGAHATTRLCLGLLLELAAADESRGPVLDVGAGSGVLAIAAAKLGYAPVLALDNDRESVRAIIDNAAVNGVEIEARRFDLRGDPLPSGSTVVLANLLRPLLLDLARTTASPPPHLIASGLLCEQADEVSQEFAKRLGLRERARRERAEWAALWLSSDRAAR